MSTNKNALPYLALAGVCILWGTTYLALRVGVTQFPPLLFSTLRFLMAGPILIGLMVIMGKKIPSWKILKDQALGGLLMCTLGVSVVGWAEVNVSSGLAAIICSMIPIWIIIVNLIMNKEERPTPMIMLGFLVGLSGILIIFSEHLVELYRPEYLKSVVAIFFANLCWATGTVLMKKRSSGSDPFMNAGWQMLFGGLFLIPLSLLFDDYSTIRWTSEIAYALFYLMLVGSVAAYACYFYAIKKLPMTIVSLYAYVNPIIAVVLGWAALDEKLNARIVAAIAITLLGIYLVNRGHQMKSEWKAQLSKS